MFKYRATRKMTEYEEKLIETIIFSINLNPHEEFTVYCDTLDPRCLPFITTLIKRVKSRCPGINGGLLLKDRIIFGGEANRR